MNGALRWALCIFAAACVVWLAGLIAPGLPLSPRLAFSVAFFAVSVELVAASRLACLASGAQAALVAVVSVAALIFLRTQPISALSAASLTAVLLLGATSLGAAIGTRIQQPGHLLAVFGISSLADLWSVYDPTGPSAKLAEQAASQPERLIVFALPWPMLGTSRIEAIIGAGDILFAALYLAALSRHGLRATRVAFLMVGALMVGLVCLLVFERALPLLPLIGAAVVFSEAETRSLSARDRRSVTVVLTVLSAVIAYRLLR